MQELRTIVELSHEFGTVDYVKGGGGNSSVKNSTTLWVKPSGTTLGGLTAKSFVALNRARINELYTVATPTEPEVEKKIKTLFGPDGAFVASSGMFAVSPGPATPDHMVYAKAFPFTGSLTPDAAAKYKAERGYAPKVVVAGNRVYGIGPSQKSADLALEVAQDESLVIKLAEAFGGIEYVSDAAREFIENWEVESYRQKQAG